MHRVVPETPRPHTLRQYALLADGERGGIIGPDGALVWLCFPRWHDDAVFGALIGAHGFYRVEPRDPYVWGGYYEDGTLVWRSRWITTHGVIECREALATPATKGRAVILRRVIAREGRAHVVAALEPATGFGHHRVRSLTQRDGAWVGITGDVHVRWSGAEGAQLVRDRDRTLLDLELNLAEGEHHDLVVELDCDPFSEPPPDPTDQWQRTDRWWSTEVPSLDHVEPRRAARHATAVLRGLTSTNGGLVAAATTSLPERAEAGRNYDYRYVWVRDLCLAGLAYDAAGLDELLASATSFVTARLLDRGPDMPPATTIDGARVPDQRSLSLPGYPGGFDRIGNHVNDQFQLDAFGQSLLLFAAAARRGFLDADGWHAVGIAVDTIVRRRDEPGAGIWELPPARWTHSRLECVAGLRAIAAVPGAPEGSIAGWLMLADDMLADASRTSLDPDGRWRRAPDDERVDAALLLGALHGATAVDDPRARATHDAILAELGADRFLYRFRHDARPLEAAEGAFLLSGFWMAQSLLARGEITEAVRWFERNRAACGPPALLAEEFDVDERQLRGNLPQAFVHAGLLECAARVSAASPDPAE